MADGTGLSADPTGNPLSTAAEAVVVAAAMRGDDAAFSELMRRRQSQIRNLLRRLCRNCALADDLAQTAFLQAWRTLRSLRAPGAFGGWLRKLAVNVWLQHLRGPGAHREVELDDAQAGAPQHPSAGNPEPSTAAGEQVDLDRALSLLAPDVRLCIVLSYAERMSHREICETTGFPLGTVKSHIARGAARLRESLSAYRVNS